MAFWLRAGRGAVVALLLAAAASCPLPAQTLAHKGWAGSGITVDPWWNHAVFYELDPLLFQDSNDDGFGDLNGIAMRLDYLQTLGVDALVLSPFPLQPGSAGKAPFEARYGSEEDFDKLQQEASRRKMRLLVDLPAGASQTEEQVLASARFWLSRGVAGLRATSLPGEMPGNASGNALGNARSDAADRLRALRRLCASFQGERVVLAGALQGPLGSTTGSGRRGRPRPTAMASTEDTILLKIDETLASATAWSPAAMAAALFHPSGTIAVSDTAARARSWYRYAGEQPRETALALAKMVASVLFLGREQPMLYFGQEVGMAAEAAHPLPMQWGGQMDFTSGTPWVEMSANEAAANVSLEEGDADSLLNWYRLMSRLRHEQAALHAGAVLPVETGYPDVVAWVRKGSGTRDQPLLAVCNLSPQPRRISVAESLRRLKLSTAYGVRAIALSIHGMDPSYAASGIGLPGYGVYIGELRQPGLEDAPAPVLPRHRRR